jgi:hypothetical protein
MKHPVRLQAVRISIVVQPSPFRSGRQIDEQRITSERQVGNADSARRP